MEFMLFVRNAARRMLFLLVVHPPQGRVDIL